MPGTKLARCAVRSSPGFAGAISFLRERSLGTISERVRFGSMERWP